MGFSSNNASGAWYILFAAMLWGTTGTAQGLAPAGATPLTIGTVRMAIGGLSLLALAISRKQFASGNRWPLTQVFISAFFVASYQLCFFAAVAKTGIAVGTMVAIGSSPLAAGILGFLIRKETLERKWYVATFLAVFGCILLSIPSKQLDLDVAGVFLALGAGFSYAIYTVSIKGLLDKHSPDAVMAVVFTSAALLMTPTIFFADWTWILQAQGLFVALHLGIVTAALAYWLFARGLRIVKVGNVATLSLAEPLTASLLGVLVLNEHLGMVEGLGIFLIFSGIVVLAVVPAKRTVDLLHQ